MTDIKENEVLRIINDINKAKIDIIDISKIKYKHHEASKIEPDMNDKDYQALLRDIELVGSIHTPIVLYKGKILDGRHRQKAAIHLGIHLPTKIITKEYTLNGLKEYVRSIHMGRDKNKVQKQIQAFKYKQSTIGITYKIAADRYGQSERSIKTITSLFKTLKEHGYELDFNKILSLFEAGKTIRPDQFEWLNKTTGTFFGTLKQLNDFIEKRRLNDNSRHIYDPTEQQEVIDSETGEVKIVDIKKDNNIFQSNAATKEELIEIIRQLQQKIEQLEQQQ